LLDDLDREMDKRGVSGIVVIGETTLENPDLTYVVGGALARGGIYFKRLGRSPLLLLSNLDIGSAKRLGRVRRIETYTEWGMEELTRKYGSRGEASDRLIARVLKKEGISGKITLFGRTDLASGLHLADKLRKIGVKVVGSRSPTVLESARETKSASEIHEIRTIGEKTAEVVNEIARLLRNVGKRRDRLYLGREQATIGLVKSIIATKLAERKLIAPEGTIFAIGSSGADPHNSGVESDEIKPGKLIVFDIFPQAESGYWYDLTRTFVVGRADRKSRRLFNTVKEAQAAAFDVLRPGASGDQAMLAACDVVERAGYRTIKDIYEGKSKSVLSGFNHSLGHGVGLTIGERPYLSFYNNGPLRKRQVVTVEPGIYLPKYGGVRIEDTVTITQRGYDNLADVERELELT
jgi:Xaa-Pro aminopeptidase